MCIDKRPSLVLQTISAHAGHRTVPGTAGDRARDEHAHVIGAVLVDPARAVEPQHLPGPGGGDHHIADVGDRGDQTAPTQIKTPAGSYDAALIRWTYKGKVGPAKIEDSQYRFFAENVGMVASVDKPEISALLVYQDHTKFGKLLAQAPK